MTTIEQLRKEGFIGKTNRFDGRLNDCRWSKARQTIFLKLMDNLKLETAYLPEGTPNKLRRLFLEKGLTKNNFQCRVPNCNNFRQYTNYKFGFSEVCSVKNKEHTDVRNNIMVKKLEDITLTKYNVKNISKLESVKYQKKITTLNNYGVSNPTYCHYNLESLNKLSKTFIESNFLENNKYFRLKDFMKFLNCSELAAWNTIKKFKVNYTPRKGQSMPEQDIIKFIKTLDPDTEIITNSRKIIAPKELDIYLPEYKLAIEYNGLMFHSQGVSKFPMFHSPNKDKNIHLNKTQFCNTQDIQLLHIQDNEWLTPHLQEIWKSVIRNKMHKNKNRVGARKCIIKKVHSKEAGEFLDSNHLQGSGSIGPHRYGLYYNQELVALMTFGAARFSNTDYELIRFAVKQNWTVMGAASKLMKAFSNEHQGTLVSYANCRWSDGGLYKTLGFKLKHISPPNFYVFHPRDIFKLWHRASFQKHKLGDRFKNFDASQTAEWNLFNNGYRKIYDSGNYVFIHN